MARHFKAYLVEIALQARDRMPLIVCEQKKIKNTMFIAIST